MSFVKSIGIIITCHHQPAAYTGGKAAQPSSCSQGELRRPQSPAPTLRQVRALVRGRDQAALEAIPQSVAVVRGDIGSYDDCLRAMQVLPASSKLAAASAPQRCPCHHPAQPYTCSAFWKKGSAGETVDSSASRHV